MKIPIPEAPMKRHRNRTLGSALAHVSAFGIAMCVAIPTHAGVDGAVEWVSVLRTSGEGLLHGFGTSIATDSGVIAVGAGWDSGRGSVAVFEQDRDDPQQFRFTTKIVPPFAQGQTYFGGHVDVHGDQIIVGAGLGFGASIFRRDETGAWNFAARLQSNGGRLLSTRVRIEGDTAMVNGWLRASDEQIGEPALFVYQRFDDAGTDWRPIRTIVSPLPDKEAAFARQFDLHNGEVIIPQWSGRMAFLFGRDTGGPGQWGLRSTMHLPSDVYYNETFNGGVSIEGGIIAFGTTHAYNDDYLPTGAVHVFEQDQADPERWRYAHRLQPPSEGYSHHIHHIGTDVEVSGRLMLVGTLRHGAYLYAKGELPGARWRLVAEINAPDVLPGRAFGNVVAMQGATAVVGGVLSRPGGSGLSERGIVPETAHVLRIVRVCAYDITGDNVVDTADLGVLLSAFGSDSAIADLDHNGLVDTVDLAMLLTEFGATDCAH